MSDRICPWWAGYLLAHPLRKLLQDPDQILRPHVAAGMRALEPGPGMGFFTLPLARLVGERGRVFCVDLEPRMLAGLRRRAERAGLAARIEARLGSATALGLDDLAGSLDFALAFAMVHEVPEPDRLFAEIRAALKSGAHLLVCEPRGHVTADAFVATLARAGRAGFELGARPAVPFSHAALLRRT